MNPKIELEIYSPFRVCGGRFRLIQTAVSNNLLHWFVGQERIVIQLGPDLGWILTVVKVLHKVGQVGVLLEVHQGVKCHVNSRLLLLCKRKHLDTGL